MKRMVTAILMLTLLPAGLRADKQETVEELKARVATADAKKQVQLSADIAERQLKTADAAYTAGKAEQAQAALADVVEYGVKAAKMSSATGKRMKQTEIALRRIDERLEAIRKAIDSDDRPPVAAAIQKLEAARTDLLNTMFRK